MTYTAAGYLRNMWWRSHQRMRPMLDLFMQQNIGKIMHVDHSFKVIKYMARVCLVFFFLILMHTRGVSLIYAYNSVRACPSDRRCTYVQKYIFRWHTVNICAQ